MKRSILITFDHENENKIKEMLSVFLQHKPYCDVRCGESVRFEVGLSLIDFLNRDNRFVQQQKKQALMKIVEQIYSKNLYEEHVSNPVKDGFKPDSHEYIVRHIVASVFKDDEKV